ncbi:hypothetical protein B9Z55_017378 [Caenorhabditis nigoni]|uniref:G-protein coupled receptors family 1 profile domain-containing protein n=1 Tax=Caenorhabditis nigoni TaxID=1611254 RepID=A0A2G5T9F2_9PELO|nr:hypothetical protein B9Z55_017378 [Caenorhabditis nigoni]
MSSTATVIPTTTAAPKDIVTYVDIPSWFNDAFNLFNYVLAILQFFAIAITLTHLIILTRKDLRFNTIYRMMIGICICDLISQVLGFIAFSPFWIRSVKPGQECYVTVTYQDALINKYGVGVLDDTQRSATWLGMFMALYRVLCDGTQNILPETEERYLTTVPREKSDLHAKITFIYGIIKALPSLIEPVLAVLLILEIRKASKRRQIIKKSEEKDNTTSFILFITMSSFLLEVPNGFSHFAFSYFENSPLIRTIAYLIMCFAEIFPVINSSSHPIVCFFMSTQYRETAKSLFGFTKNAKVIFVEECKTKTRNTTKTARESF